MIRLGTKNYKLIKENRDALDMEVLQNRYSDILEKYDYIVGDWGYDQMRLKGFFQSTHPKANKDTSIDGLQDYLDEYCNFGCAYFVLEKVD